MNNTKREYIYFIENDAISFRELLPQIDAFLTELDDTPVEGNEQYWIDFLASWDEILEAKYRIWLRGRSIKKDMPFLIAKLKERMNFTPGQIKQGEYVRIKTKFIIELGIFLNDLGFYNAAANAEA